MNSDVNISIGLDPFYSFFNDKYEIHKFNESLTKLLFDITANDGSLFIPYRDKAILAFENNKLITIVGISVAKKRTFKKLIEVKVEGMNYLDNTNNLIKIENVLNVIDNWLKKVNSLLIQVQLLKKQIRKSQLYRVLPPSRLVLT